MVRKASDSGDTVSMIFSILSGLEMTKPMDFFSFFLLLHKHKKKKKLEMSCCHSH